MTRDGGNDDSPPWLRLRLGTLSTIAIVTVERRRGRVGEEEFGNKREQLFCLSSRLDDGSCKARNHLLYRLVDSIQGAAGLALHSSKVDF